MVSFFERIFRNEQKTESQLAEERRKMIEARRKEISQNMGKVGQKNGEEEVPVIVEEKEEEAA